VKLFDEFRLSPGARCMPRLEEELQLDADVVVPDRGRSRHFDRVRADLLCDVLPLSKEGDEAADVGCFPDSNSHPQV
jgi:hypothetical protein